MNKQKNSLPTIYKVIAAVLSLYGVLIFISALTILMGTGFSGYATFIASENNIDMGGNFPYAISVLGSLIFMLLSFGYFAAAYSLLKFKIWAPFTFYFLGLIGILDTIVGFYTNRPYALLQLLWVVAYVVFGYYLSKNTQFKSK